MRKSISKGSNEADRTYNHFDQENWSNGVVNDPPGASIPDSSLAESFNVIPYPKELRPRTGTRLYTTNELPPLAGRSGYSGTKTGYIIATTQSHFTESDVGNYFVWPGTETEHDQIVRYIDGRHVEVADSGTKTIQYGCYLRGPLNLWCFHSVLKKWLFMVGSEFWYVDITMGTWEEVRIVSYDITNSAITGCQEFDEFSWITWNSNGIFKIDVETKIPQAYRINIPVPNVAIAEQVKTVDTDYQYGYIYGSLRMAGNGHFRNRLTPSRIEIETGTNSWGSDYKDFNDIWTENPIGRELYTYGVLTCGILASPYSDVSAFNVLDDATFTANISDIGSYEIHNDLTDAATLKDVAAIFQSSLRDFFPDATADFVEDHFVFTSGRVDGGTITYLSAGTTGTNISTALMGTDTDGAVITTPYTRSNKVVGPLYVPIVQNTDPQLYQWHMTHFPIYRTMDKNGLYKQGTSEQRLNDPERFIWVKDLRVCAAFFARKFNNHILCYVGEFEEADVGSSIEWEDGSINPIIGYVAPDDVIISEDSGYGTETYFMAAALGGGKVMRASQAGTIVTRTHGDTFSSSDLRKTITWATGYRSIITDYYDPNNVGVADDYDKGEQGLTFDPVSRYFNDTTDDDVLRTRETSMLCKTRFLEPMSLCNIGILVPGYMITAQRGNNKLEYCSLIPEYEYLVGFHNKGYQINNTIKDDIQALIMFPNKFVALCTNKTWHGPTNISEYVTMPKTGVVVSIIGGIDILDGSIGNFDWGSIREISFGIYRMLTSEPGGIGMRDFNGYTFGPNILVDESTGQTNYKDSIEGLQKATASLYDGEAGYIIWGKAK